MALPTFFLAGAPKAGTTSLFAYLAAHPDVAVSRIKEPCFFAPDIPVDADTAAARASWETYQSLFAHAGRARAIGEGSVAYFASLTAAANIHTRIPAAVIVLLLRDPADRLFAHYKAARTSGAAAASFAAWVDAQQSIEAARSPGYGAVWAGFYARHLERWRARFPAHQIHTAFYDDFTRDPAQVLASVFTAIGVDPAAAIDTRARYNETTVPIGAAPIRRAGAWAARVLPTSAAHALRRAARRPVVLEPTRDERARAIAIYADDIRRLADGLGRDLRAWLDPDSRSAAQR